MMGLWSGQAAQLPAAGMAARLAPLTPPKPEVLRATGADSSGWSLQGGGKQAPLFAPQAAGVEPSAWPAAEAPAPSPLAAPAATAAPSAAPGVWRVALASGSVLLGAVAGSARKQRRSRGKGGGRGAQVVLRAVETAAPPAVDKAAGSKSTGETVEEVELPGRPLQIVKIDLESNNVVLGDEELKELEAALRKTGAQKVAVIGVMGAFRTGKSFLLDLMLRYLQPEKQAPTDKEECEVPTWVQENSVPEWAVKCGTSVVEGREGGRDTEGFIWRPGMEKCTEGVWIWSKPFVRKAGGEDVALVLMDTQGAWDAKMTKEQSATVFGLTTLMTSRLIYNVSRQIQQDKIDNLLYFTDFAKAALRTKEKSVAIVGEGKRAEDTDSTYRPFQTLEFLVRDWPHYPEEVTLDSGRAMMEDHLKQYFDAKRVEDTKSIDALKEVFEGIDCWCLPHPSLSIERESWNGDLSVVEPGFWRFVDAYMNKIFSPEELRAKATLGTPLTVDTFSTVIREFIMSFRNAAPQAKTFSEAMETSTSLMARDVAMKLLKKKMDKETENDTAMEPARFDKVAEETAEEVEKEFSSRAIFGSEEGIKKVSDQLQQDVKDELERYREENERRLEASLIGLTNVSLAALTAFGVDRVSDITCDWWSPFCQELSQDLSVGYIGVAAYVAYSIYSVNEKEGGMDATVAAIELAKSIVKRTKKITREFSEKS